jgi:hypothetical protein
LDGESSTSSRNDPSRARWGREMDGAWEADPYESGSFRDGQPSGGKSLR